MKKVLRISKLALLFLSLSVVIISCGDDDDKKKSPKNQIQVDGKKFDFARGYIVSEEVTNEDDVVVGSAHRVFLAGGDLEIGDELVVTGEGHLLEMYIGVEDELDLVADEYDVDYFEFDLGNVAIFDLFENYAFDNDSEEFVFDAWYSGNDDGTVTVSTSDDKHIFKIDMEEYYFFGDSEDETTEDLISEALTGYFKGELEVITVSEGTRKRLSNLRRSRKAN